jgi:polyisoprenyl-teichoic acid--peptidoglycan teichoic acid transferase
LSRRYGADPPPRRRRVVEPEPPPRRAGSRRPPQPPSLPHDRIAVFVAGLLGLLGILTGFIAFTMVRAQTLNPIVGVASYFIPTPQALFGKNRIYVLLLGLDYDYDNLDQPSSKDSRTDKIEAFALDFPTKVIKSVAVPRDFIATIAGQPDKINDAYQHGGWRGSDAVVGPLLSMPKNDAGTYFDRYVVLRINASKDLINAIGGLDVPVTQELDHDDNWGHLHIHFHPGLQHMDGDQAVSYARFRHDACSDPCRIERQQQIERLVIEKLKRDRFNDLAHIGGLIDVVRRDVDTNLTPDEMRSLAWYFRDVDLADVHSTQLPYSGDEELACCGDTLLPDSDVLQKIVADFLGPYTAVPPPPTSGEVAAVKPAAITVVVLNGTGVSGLAHKMADQLRHDGYVIKRVGNADSFDYGTTEIQAHTNVPLAGERLLSDLHLPGAKLAPTPAASPSPPESDLTLVVGRDYAQAPKT